LRIRTQFRQIYVAAHASLLGCVPGDAVLQHAADVCRRLRRLAFDARHAAWIHRLDARGNVDDPLLDLYDQAFAINGLLWLARATGEADFQTWATEVLEALARRFALPGGGYMEDDRGTLPRRQNPHMHLFEAAIAGMELGYGNLTAPLAASMYGLFEERFVEHETGRLTEFFGPNWERQQSYGSDRYEPGHAAEWVWLLSRYARLTGRTLDRWAAELLVGVRQILSMQAGGLLPDVVDADGRPLSSGCRLWPQLEYLKASTVTPDLQGNAANTFAARVMRLYVEGMPRGCWRDRIAHAGQAAERVPASIVYHLFSLAAELRSRQANG
jgi:mannose-6-phosphate isomerase